MVIDKFEFTNTESNKSSHRNHEIPEIYKPKQIDYIKVDRKSPTYSDKMGGFM